MYGGSVGKIMRALDNALDNESVRSLDNLLVPQSDGRHVRRLGALDNESVRALDNLLVPQGDGRHVRRLGGEVEATGALDNGQVR